MGGRLQQHTDSCKLPKAFLKSDAPGRGPATYRVTRPRDALVEARTLRTSTDSSGSNYAAGATRRAMARINSASQVGLAAPVSIRDM